MAARKVIISFAEPGAVQAYQFTVRVIVPAVVV